MKKYAQIYQGKIIYFEETEDLKTLLGKYSPNTIWQDVTNVECGLGWDAKFDENSKLVLTPPPKSVPPTLEELKAMKLKEIDLQTGYNITGGFTSSCTGTAVKYDSDRDTQLTMQGIGLNVDNIPKHYPNGIPVRGYEEGHDYKTVFMFDGPRLKQWLADLYLHIGRCKEEGWKKQDEVQNCQSMEELEKIEV